MSYRATHSPRLVIDEDIELSKTDTLPYTAADEQIEFLTNQLTPPTDAVFKDFIRKSKTTNLKWRTVKDGLSENHCYKLIKVLDKTLSSGRAIIFTMRSILTGELTAIFAPRTLYQHIQRPDGVLCPKLIACLERSTIRYIDVVKHTTWLEYRFDITD